MNAIILAAGMGVRLLPNTKNVPKGMLKYVNPVFTEGKWCEIDTPEDLRNAEKSLRTYTGPAKNEREKI